MPPISIQVVTNGGISSFYYGLIILHCRYTQFFTHSSIDRRLDCFHVLVIANNAATNMGMQIFFPVSVSVSFQYILRRRIGRLHGTSIFKFFRDLYTVFQFTFPMLNYISANSAHGFPFFHLLTNTCYFLSY